MTDAAIVTAILEQNPQRVLNVGCGEGWLARALSSHGITVTGIDGSVPLIEAAQALGGGTFLAVSYEEVAADPSLLGFTFDTIVANFSILDDRAEELARALLPMLARDGRLIVQSVHPLSSRGEFSAIRERGNVLECGSRSCRFCMFERCQWHTKAAAAATALQIGACHVLVARITARAPPPATRARARLHRPRCAVCPASASRAREWHRRARQ